MKPLSFPLLADENIHPDVIRGLAERARDVCSVVDAGLAGQPDATILRHAHSQGRVVLTHDSDFGTLAIRAGEPFTGVIYLRPGHISSAFVMLMLEAVESARIDVAPPFIVVAARRGATVRVRVRSGVGAG